MNPAESALNAPLPIPDQSQSVSELAEKSLSLTEDLERSSRQSKVVATVRLKDNSEIEIPALIKAGCNVFRLNFSHGSYEEHDKLSQIIRRVSHEMDCPVAIMQDLCGPKLRIGNFANGEIELKDNQVVELRHASKAANAPDSITTEAFYPEDTLKVGSRFFLSDGKYEFKVESVGAEGVKARVVRGGVVRSRAGISLPDSDVSLPAITDKDLRDLEWGLKNGVDFAVLSFVREAAEVHQLREEMRRLGRVIPIVAKIERKVALENLNEITEAADALMVGRGDLGTEIPEEQIPAAQRKIVAAGLAYGKPVTVATQMFLSMVHSDHPTRAEVNDVARATMDGADSVMLSEETAIGDFPAEAVSKMAKTAKAGEAEFDFAEHEDRTSQHGKFDCPDSEVIAISAAAASIGSGIQAIILASNDPDAPRLISKHRPRVPIYGCSADWDQMQKMSLYWGIHPLPFPERLQSPSLVSSRMVKEYAFKEAAIKHFLLHPEATDFGAIILNDSTLEANSPMSRLEIRRVTKEELYS